MYLHIGNKKSVKVENIIGIFDLDTATVTKSTKEFINKMERSALVEYDDTDLPRSFVLEGEGESKRIRLSRISTQGLKLRLSEKIY